MSGLYLIRADRLNFGIYQQTRDMVHLGHRNHERIEPSRVGSA